MYVFSWHMSHLYIQTNVTINFSVVLFPGSGFMLQPPCLLFQGNPTKRQRPGWLGFAL